MIFPDMGSRLRDQLDQKFPGFRAWFLAIKTYFASLLLYKGGLITLAAGTTLTAVSDARVVTSSVIVLQETNPAAGALAQRPYVLPSDITAGVGFNIGHVAAAGGEQFNYILMV